MDPVDVKSALDATAKEKRWGTGPAPNAGPEDFGEKEKEPAQTRKVRQDSAQLPSVPIPSVVDKAAEKPSFGDDFGENATAAQKLAHDLKSADVIPDCIVTHKNFKSYVEPGSEEERSAPLFRHESLEAENSQHESSLPSSMDMIEEEPLSSTADQASSYAEVSSLSTPPSRRGHGLSQEDRASHETESADELGNGDLLSHETDMTKGDELDFGPLLSHETGSSPGGAGIELDHGPLMSHEAELSNESKDFSELDQAPLMSHETGLSSESKDFGELDNGPLMSHETELPESNISSHPPGSAHFLTVHYGLSKGQGPRDIQGDDVEGGTFDPARAPTFSREVPQEELEDNEVGFDDVPLLPHERSSFTSATSERSDGVSSEVSFPTFSERAAGASPIFGRRSGSGLFRARSNSSNLPHSLPRSDEEDDNLNDPSLEAFPTSREQIFARVATIGSHLPEDEAVPSPNNMHSPPFSVVSQACSSVDLAPISSHLSLRAIAEDAVMEDDEGEEASDLPSPVLEISSRASPSGEVWPPTALSGEAKRQAGRHGTAGADGPQGRGAAAARPGAQEELSDEESVQRHDGAFDGAKRWGVVYPVSRPGKMEEPLTPPKSPEKHSAPSTKGSSLAGSGEGSKKEVPAKPAPNTNTTDVPAASTSLPTTAPSSAAAISHEARRRVTRKPSPDSSSAHRDPKLTMNAPTDAPATTSNNARGVQPDSNDDNRTKTLFRTVFGPVGRAFMACFGRGDPQ